jgi:hypothetical protein
MLAMPDGLQVCLKSMREAFRCGMLGHAWEEYLLVHPWRFSLEEIRVRSSSGTGSSILMRHPEWAASLQTP